MAGLEFGAWATFDRGGNWTSLGSSLPPAPVHDLVFQQSTGALVLGTHGRSIWVLDNAAALAGLTPEVTGGQGHLFPVGNFHHKAIHQGQFWFGAGEFFAPNPPYGALLTYYLPRSFDSVRLTVTDAAGELVRTMRGPAQAGLNRACWDSRRDAALPAVGLPPVALCSPAPSHGPGPLAPAGAYRVTVTTPAGDTFSAGRSNPFARPLSSR